MNPFDPSQATDTREEYLEAWRRTERFMERVGGVVLIMAGGLMLTGDPSSDPFVLFATPGLVAAGLALILRRRRIAMVQIHLSYLGAAHLANRALMSGLGGAIALYIGVTQQIFSLFITGLLLVGLGIWYQWRSRMAQQYEMRFSPSPVFNKSDAEQAEEE